MALADLGPDGQPAHDRGAAAYVVAHELGLDVRVAAELVAQAQAAHGRGDADEVAALLTRLKQALDRFRRDIDHLVVSGGGSLDRLQPNPTNLRELVQRVVESHPTSQHPVDVQAASVLVSVDAVKVERIVDNLLANALMHTPPGCPVRVSVAAVPGGVELTVEDRGPGLPDPLRKLLFDAEQDVPPEAAGGAMGLWVVTRFTRLHGGTVSVDDGPNGTGARFTVSLPATPANGRRADA